MDSCLHGTSWEKLMIYFYKNLITICLSFDNKVIIDEAGMCSEPESMVPIVAAEESIEEAREAGKGAKNKPPKVVLIGDHKQLQPIIKSRDAQKVGLNVSLFERHANIKSSVMEVLNFQYRMVRFRFGTMFCKLAAIKTRINAFKVTPTTLIK